MRAHINIYFTEKIFFGNLNNLVAASGRPAPELGVKTLKWYSFHRNLSFSSRKNIKIISHIIEANLNLPGGRWSLILEASQVQLHMSYSNMPSCMTKCRDLKVRISFLTSKIISGYLEAAGG